MTTAKGHESEDTLTRFIDWLSADLNHAALVLLLALGVLAVCDATLFGNPWRSRCNHPNKHGGRDANPVPPPGGHRCAQGHTKYGWVIGHALLGVMLLGVASYVRINHPIPDSTTVSAVHAARTATFDHPTMRSPSSDLRP